MRIPAARRLIIFLACGISLGCDAIATRAATLETAREHLQKGRYEEAAAEYEALSEDPDHSELAAIGLSRALQSQGQREMALNLLDTAIKDTTDSADLFARRAELQFDMGRLAAAEESAGAALAIDADHVQAKLVQASVFVSTGRLEEADQTYVWFVRYYNRRQPTDASTLVTVANGAAQYARWHSSPSIFSFIINTLCPDALKDDPLSWETHLLSGSLLLEKFNRAQAIPDLQKALAINPRAVPVLVALAEAALQKHDLAEAATLADQALAVDASSASALRVKADVLLLDGKLAEAVTTLEMALTHNPSSPLTLGRLACCRYLSSAANDDEAAIRRLVTLLAGIDTVDQVTLEEPTPVESIIIRVAQQNAHPGEFLTAFAAGLESRRRYPLAEKLYQHAIRVMPQLAEPRSALGMLYMQMGRTEDAERILDDAFKVDPYHVRVSNMRKVLRVLGDYDTITTDHFVVRVDSAQDRILGEYMAEYLEEIYPDLVKLYGFEPPHRTTFEIYNNAKGLSAHQWFSARMVGLPWIQTIGASTGMMVALASPTASKEHFNWARVVKHEFVHIITLQQTRFNIPHWFTEALAVTSEDIQRPAVWNRLLAERVPRGQLSSLDELNHVFVRPETPLDWQFAYCQSRLYAQYMIETFGEETIAAMLDGYRQGTPTNDLIPQVFNIPVEEFEAGYRKFLNDIVTNELGVAVEGAPASLAELEKAHLADLQNSKKAAAYALALFKLNRRTQAGELAEAVLVTTPKEPDALLVQAQLKVIAQEIDEAATILERGFDSTQPHLELTGLLAELRLRQGRWEEAVKLYDLARKSAGPAADASTQSDRWRKGMAAAFLELGDTNRLRAILEEIAAHEIDEPGIRNRLAQMAFDQQDYPTARRWATESLQINVLDVDIHRLLAKIHTAEGNEALARRENAVADEIDGMR